MLEDSSLIIPVKTQTLFRYSLGNLKISSKTSESKKSGNARDTRNGKNPNITSQIPLIFLLANILAINLHFLMVLFKIHLLLSIIKLELLSISIPDYHEIKTQLSIIFNKYFRKGHY